MQMTQEVEEMQKWETIIDYTTEEDTANFCCDTDVNGEPFRLKECIVYLKVMPCEDNEDKEVLIKINFSKNDVWRSPVATIASSVKNTDKYFKSCVHFKKIGESFLPLDFFRSYNKNSVADAMTNLVPPGAYGFFDMDDDFTIKDATQYIENIAIGSYLKVIGKGTRLKVIGIRV